ncbi:energy-coupling factor transporter ATP-binding protein EcfA1 [Clostridia bacterium]|nr:energy-coupling factor transporter ATP-binding protein EcfA1 [Clostridia bacterium]
MAIISVEDVSFTYFATDSESGKADYALKNISLEFEEGTFTAVLGHNGSGKSTLAKLISVILLPTAGKITVDGIDASDEARMFDIRKNVGMVFQNPDNQIVASIVEEDVAFGPENLGVPPDEIRTRVDESLELVGMSEYKLHSPHKLSGGQKQRVAIAGILAMHPKVIILDEATAMLDPSGRREVMQTIMRLNKKLGMTVILITHYMNEAVDADRVIVLSGGEVYLDGTPRKVFSQIDKIKSAGLEVPQVTELFHELSEKQKSIAELKRFAFPDDVLHTMEAADILQSQIKH